MTPGEALWEASSPTFIPFSQWIDTACPSDLLFAAAEAARAREEREEAERRAKEVRVRRMPAWDPPNGVAYMWKAADLLWRRSTIPLVAVEATEAAWREQGWLVDDEAGS